MAEPHPKVLNLTSLIRPLSSTRIWSFITSPQAGAPTLLHQSPTTNTQFKRKGVFGGLLGGELQSGADVDVGFGKGAHIPWPFVVVNDFFMVETRQGRGDTEIPCGTESGRSKHRWCGRRRAGSGREKSLRRCREWCDFLRRRSDFSPKPERVCNQIWKSRLNPCF
jgi:hypothetical protein